MGARKRPSRSDGAKRTTSYATAVAYFDALPNGWASFPQCVARASLLGNLRDRGALDSLDALPPRLRPLLAHLSTEAEWLPEVLHVATLLAVRDARFGDGPRADDDFLGWLAQLNRDLLGAPTNAATLEVGAPGDLVPRLPFVWESFHRGTPMTVIENVAGRARFTLAHPRQLFSSLSLESHRRVLALALAKAGAVQPLVTMTTKASGDQAATAFDATWS